MLGDFPFLCVNENIHCLPSSIAIGRRCLHTEMPSHAELFCVSHSFIGFLTTRATDLATLLLKCSVALQAERSVVTCVNYESTEIKALSVCLCVHAYMCVCFSKTSF